MAMVLFWIASLWLSLYEEKRCLAIATVTLHKEACFTVHAAFKLVFGQSLLTEDMQLLGDKLIILITHLTNTASIEFLRKLQ